MLQRLDRRVGVVDGGRQRLDGDVGELPHPERDILFGGALVAQADRHGERFARRPPGPVEGVRGRCPHPQQRRSFDDELAHHGGHGRDQVAVPRQREQHVGTHGLDPAGLVRRHRDGPGGRRRCRLGADSLRGQVVLDHPERAALDAPHDFVDLDGVRQVVHEEHQHEQADEEQGQRKAHREPRVVLHPLSRRDPDREQAGRAVGERGDEDAEHHLVGPVPQEVAQQAGVRTGSTPAAARRRSGPGPGRSRWPGCSRSR